MILRFMFFVCGFHRVKIIGKQAGPNQARILAVAPHSTFFDALAVVVMGAPSVVAKAETNSIPFWGSLIKLTQPVLVHRLVIVHGVKYHLNYYYLLFFYPNSKTKVFYLDLKKMVGRGE